MSSSVSLKTVLAGIPLECCIYNASGPRTGSAAALSKIASSASGAVLAKSATVEKQLGNPQPRTWQSDEASLNSEGLPNSGIEYYLDPSTIAESMGTSSSSSTAATPKPYFVSISGKTLEDNLAMMKRVIETNTAAAASAHPPPVASLELNLACPNIIGKPIIAYDFDQLETVLSKVSQVKGIESLRLGLKLPPYFDGPHFQQAAKIINKYKHIVKYVASINTIGNALAIDGIAEMPMISSKGGFAGLSGRAVKYTALANVRQMRLLLDSTIDVVGVGGVETGMDAFELLLCGATAVQVGTCHWREGPKCFDRIAMELRELMYSKGYYKLLDVQGKLKEWNKDGASASRAARKGATSNAMTVSTNGDGSSQLLLQLLMGANALFIIVIAWLLADKFGVVSF